MNSMENIKLLFCFNEAGEEKVNEILNNLLLNTDYLRTTPEQLDLELKEQRQQDEESLKSKEEKKKQIAEEKEAKLSALCNKYKNELQIIGGQHFPVNEFDMLDAIRATNRGQFLSLCDTYNWGYIQGKRSERARRKKVSL